MYIGKKSYLLLHRQSIAPSWGGQYKKLTGESIKEVKCRRRYWLNKHDSLHSFDEVLSKKRRNPSMYSLTFNNLGIRTNI